MVRIDMGIVKPWGRSKIDKPNKKTLPPATAKITCKRSKAPMNLTITAYVRNHLKLTMRMNITNSTIESKSSKDLEKSKLNRNNDARWMDINANDRSANKINSLLAYAGAVYLSIDKRYSVYYFAKILYS